MVRCLLQTLPIHCWWADSRPFRGSSKVRTLRLRIRLLHGCLGAEMSKSHLISSVLAMNIRTVMNRLCECRNETVVRMKWCFMSLLVRSVNTRKLVDSRLTLLIYETFCRFAFYYLIYWFTRCYPQLTDQQTGSVVGRCWCYIEGKWQYYDSSSMSLPRVVLAVRT